jgi:hypothetical protein
LKISLYNNAAAVRVKILGDDDAREFITMAPSQESRVVQSVHFLRGTKKTFFARGGRALQKTWTVNREHADEAAAKKFERDHANEIQPDGDLEILDAGVTSWIVGAVVADINCLERSGRTTIFQYTIQGPPATSSRT